jgi:hypothetical protein
MIRIPFTTIYDFICTLFAKLSNSLFYQMVLYLFHHVMHFKCLDINLLPCFFFPVLGPWFLPISIVPPLDIPNCIPMSPEPTVLPETSPAYAWGLCGYYSTHTSYHATRFTHLVNTLISVSLITIYFPIIYKNKNYGILFIVSRQSNFNSILWYIYVH